VGRPDRAAFQAYGRHTAAGVRPHRLGRAPRSRQINALLRARLIGVLGTFGDDAIVAEARRRFAKFVSDPTSLPTALRETVTSLAGRYADRAIYDTLLGSAAAPPHRRAVRYYMAAASAHDPALVNETLAMALTDELPTTLVAG